MAKHNGKNGRNLPAKLPSKIPSQRAGLKRGNNPGPHPGGGRPDFAYRERCRALMEQHKGPEIAAAIMSGQILELIGMSKDGEPIIGLTRNADRLAAYDRLERGAGYAPPKPISIETSGDVIVQVVYDDDPPPENR